MQQDGDVGSRHVLQVAVVMNSFGCTGNKLLFYGLCLIARDVEMPVRSIEIADVCTVISSTVCSTFRSDFTL